MHGPGSFRTGRALFLAALGAAASLPALSAGQQADLTAQSSALTAKAEESVKKLTALIAASPNGARNYSNRGDAWLFAGKPKEAVADFEKMIALNPKEDAPHWRLGIAYFLNGQYEKGAKQFEKYHAYDAHDRENGVWHFFCVARKDGVEAARKRMLAYTEFDRHPFPSLYDMLAGKRTAAEVLAEIESAQASDDEKERRRFFAELYVGLDSWLAKDLRGAIRHLEKAVANRWGTELSGKTYMWQVARVMWEQWRKDLAAADAKEKGHPSPR